jgi:formylglycine-generating enzyme required for sulfatase activity
MDNLQCYGVGSGVARDGAPGGYRYAARAGRERLPVNYLNLFMAMRFANWLHNGQGDGDTETGAYTLLGGTVIPTNFLTVERNQGAKVFLPSEDEWYKAAYYDPEAKRYWDFPAGTDEEMTCAMPGPTPNTANCGLVTAANNPSNPGLSGVASWFWGHVTPVGAYTGSVSPYGAYDMGGNLFQWTEEINTTFVGQYHAGEKISPVLDAVFGITGNPFEVNGIGPCGTVRGTDFGDGGEFNHANGRTCDITVDPFETYGIRLAAAAP